MKQIKILYLALCAYQILYADFFENLLQVKSTPVAQQTLKNKGQCAITYKLEKWRRLGDNITTYCKAKYFECVYHVPLLYKPFEYSDQFELHAKETFFTQEQAQQFSKTVPINTVQDFEDALKSGQSVLCECHFLTATPWLYKFSRDHLDFEQEIKKMFTPTIPLEPLPKPESVVTIAVHVRKGGGFDNPLASTQEYAIDEQVKGIYLRKKNMAGSYTIIWPINWPPGPKYCDEVKKICTKLNTFSDYVWPIKFPPDQYYIDQIKTVADMLPERNLLVYLFTDDPNPQDIVTRYSTALQEYPRIIFSYRQAGNHHTKNVLQDLFSIAQCDCLISASSSFATVAQLLGNHSILIMPAHALIMPDKIFINKVAIFGANNADDPAARKLFYNEVGHKIK